MDMPISVISVRLRRTSASLWSLMRAKGLVLAGLTAMAAPAQAEAPLSAIDWLSDSVAVPVALHPESETDGAETPLGALPPAITVAPGAEAPKLSSPMKLPSAPSHFSQPMAAAASIPTRRVPGPRTSSR